MGAEPRPVRSAQIVPVQMGPGVVRRMLGWGERMLLAEVTLEKGAVVPPHAHPHEQIGYVARGTLEFAIGEARRVLVAGDGYVIPGGVTHSVLALEDSTAVDVFSPVREEYK